MRMIGALRHVEKRLNITKRRTLVSTSLFYLDICRDE